MRYGLSEKQRSEIINIISRHPEIEEAVLFGSRAIDTYKEASDVDIALKGKKVTLSLAAKLKFDIEEGTYLPFFFDFVAYPTITNEALKEHIDKKGVTIYRAGWKECTLADIAVLHSKAIISGSFVSNISNKYSNETSVPVIRSNNLSLDIGTRFIDDDFVFISKENAKESGAWAEKDDLIFATTRTIGQVGILQGKEKYSHYILSDKQLKVSLNKSIIEPLYAYYWFASHLIIDMVINSDMGSTIPLINLSVLKSLPLLLPTLSEQRAIVSVLSSLDDKVYLLNRQNKTLEAMEETLSMHSHKEVRSIFDKMYINQSQIRTLEKLRDTLLPKLMSGEVRVEI